MRILPKIREQVGRTYNDRDVRSRLPLRQGVGFYVPASSGSMSSRGPDHDLA